MTDINQVCASAKQLGIKLTNANLGTDICDCWIDRVLLAAMHFERGDMAACQAAIDSANAYSV
jgi:hypothetical protein